MSSLYSAEYAPIYSALYLEHPMWREKNRVNLEILGGLLSEESSWLDTCCGQGWQLARFPDLAVRVGVDLSEAQLEVARQAAPGARFHHADILEWDPGDRRFDVCSNFWGALSYLGDLDQLEAAIARLVAWTAPGGAVVLELITPSLLEAFNLTPFARDNHCAVELVSDSGPWRWRYTDPAGAHELVSPPVELYIERLAPFFNTVRHVTTVTAMAQLVAEDRNDHV